MLWAEEIPVIKHTNEKGKTATIRLIAGKYEDKKSLEPTKIHGLQRKKIMWEFSLSYWSLRQSFQSLQVLRP